MGWLLQLQRSTDQGKNSDSSVLLTQQFVYVNFVDIPASISFRILSEKASAKITMHFDDLNCEYSVGT